MPVGFESLSNAYLNQLSIAKSDCSTDTLPQRSGTLLFIQIMAAYSSLSEPSIFQYIPYCYYAALQLLILSPSWPYQHVVFATWDTNRLRCVGPWSSQLVAFATGDLCLNYVVSGKQFM